MIPGLGRSPGEGIGYSLQYSWASLVAQMVKNLPEMQETWVQSLGWEDPLEESMATQSSMLAWRIPMDRGAWWATVHGCTELHTTKRSTGRREDKALVTQLCLTLCNPKDCSLLGSSVHGDSPGKNTGVGCHALLQGIFPTQETFISCGSCTGRASSIHLSTNSMFKAI